MELLFSAIITSSLTLDITSDNEQAKETILEFTYPITTCTEDFLRRLRQVVFFQAKGTLMWCHH